jgi:SNF2 family DNA or RNA helicase
MQAKQKVGLSHRFFVIPKRSNHRSSKIEVLITELIEMRQKRPGSKALVFSQFVNMLDVSLST